EAAEVARQRGIALERAGTAGTHPRFVGAIREMVEAAQVSAPQYVCRPDCCRPAVRPTRP
ncbi:MAG: ferrochelatase, partial [Acidobacteriota bacterium]